MSLEIGLTYNLRSDFSGSGLSEEDLAEFDSEETVDAIAEAIASLGHRVVRIGDAKQLSRRLSGGETWDLVFNIAEGRDGRSREAQAPAILELYGIPYTFSDPLTCALTLDKFLAKTVVRAAGIRTPDAALIRRAGDVARINLPFPLFAKPLAEGTGKGIDHTNRVDSPAELGSVTARLLQRYRQPVLVESYLPGREFTTGILGTGEKARVLGTIEVKVKAGAPAVDYTFEVKEKCDQFVEYAPAARDETCDDVERVALGAYRALECRDGGRVDVRLDGQGRAAFLEVNPLPGLHPTHSDLPMIATNAGLDYRGLIGAILENALSRRDSSHAQ